MSKLMMSFLMELLGAVTPWFRLAPLSLQGWMASMTWQVMGPRQRGRPRSTPRTLPEPQGNCVQFWLLPPLQVQVTSCVSCVDVALGTSRQAPEARLRRVEPTCVHWVVLPAVQAS